MAIYVVELRYTTVRYTEVTVDAPNRYEAADLAEAAVLADPTLYGAPDSTIEVGYVSRVVP